MPRGNQKEPINLILAKGKKHLTKDEIIQRMAEEPEVLTENIAPPDYLTKKQRAEFDDIAEKLIAIGIMSETDCDALARYIIAKGFYLHATKQLNSKASQSDPNIFALWSKEQDKFFKQCRQSAQDLGLTISSRVRLVVPTVKKEEAPTNKFSIFNAAAGGGNGC